MMGMGMGVGFSSPPPWTPAALAPSLWMGAYEEARGTKNTQPVLVDGDMEAAGVAAWAPSSANVTRSKQGGAYAGTQCLRIANSGAEYQWVMQNVGAIPGNRYRVTGAARGDGTAKPEIQLGNASIEFVGTASNLWQPIDKNANWTLGDYAYFNAHGADGHYVEFDSLTLVNISLASYLPRIGAALAQATPTAMPWAGSLGIQFDGDLLPWGTAADAKCLHTGDGGSLGWQYRPTTLKAENRIVATAATAVGNVGVTVSCTNANTIRVRVMNGGAGYDYDSGDVACAIAINTTYAMVLRVASGAGGVSLRVNGTEVISGALTAPSAANPTTGLMLGGDAAGAATNVTGYVGQVLVVQRAMTVGECAQYEAHVAAGGL